MALEQEVLKYLIVAEDQATKVFDDLGKKLDQADSRMSGIAKTGIVVAGGLTSVAVSAGVFGAKALDMAADLEQTKIGFTTLLGSAEEADTLLKRISAEAAATPFEIKGLQQGAMALTAVTKDGDKAVDALLAVGNAISASGKGQAEMDSLILNLQQISSTGKVTEMDIRQMQSAIPIFNDIIGAAGLTTESLKTSDSAAEDLIGAFQKAAEEGGIAYGAMAAQSETFNGRMATLKDNFAIAMTTIGVSLLEKAKPAMEQLVGVSDILVTAVGPEGLSGAFEMFKEKFPELAATIDVAVQAMSKFWNEHKEEILAIVQQIRDGVTWVLDRLREFWDEWGKTIMTGVIYAFTLIKNTIVNILDIVVSVVRIALAVMRGDWDKAGEIVYNLVIRLKDRLVQTFDALADFLKELGGKILEYMTKPFRDAYDNIKDIAVNIREAISGAFDMDKRNSPSINDRLAMLKDGIQTTLEDVIIPNYSAQVAGQLATVNNTSNVTFNNTINNQMDLAMVNRELGRELETRAIY